MSVLRELAGGREHPLRGKVTLIGRDPACDVVVRTDQTSSRHAIIVQSGDSYSIEDLESVNGVYVNGARIRGRTPLRPGDRVEIPGFAASLQTTAHPSPRAAGRRHDHRPMSGGGRLEVKPEVKLRAVLEISALPEHARSTSRRCCRKSWNACSPSSRRPTAASFSCKTLTRPVRPEGRPPAARSRTPTRRPSAATFSTR